MQTGRPATLSPRGMVTSPHSLASAAGADVLRQRIERELHLRAVVPEHDSVWPA